MILRARLACPAKTHSARDSTDVSFANLGPCDKLDREGKWNVELEFRDPPPDKLGLKLELDRGNVVEDVLAKSGIQSLDLWLGD